MVDIINKSEGLPQSRGFQKYTLLNGVLQNIESGKNVPLLKYINMRDSFIRAQEVEYYQQSLSNLKNFKIEIVNYYEYVNLRILI